MLSKDEQIKKLQLALNLATRPEVNSTVNNVESKMHEMKQELQRLEKEVDSQVSKKQELRLQIAHAEKTGDRHSEIVDGAKFQDLKVLIKRGKLHISALKVALSKAKGELKTEDHLAERIPTNMANDNPSSPAAVSTPLALNGNVTDDHPSPPETQSTPPTPTSSGLKEKLKVEEEKLRQAEQEIQAEQPGPSQKAAELPPSSNTKSRTPSQAASDSNATPRVQTKASEDQAKSTRDKAKEVLKLSAKQSKATKKIVQKAAEDTKKIVKKATKPVAKDTTLAESNSHSNKQNAQTRLSLLESQLQLEQAIRLQGADNY